MERSEWSALTIETFEDEEANLTRHLLGRAELVCEDSYDCCREAHSSNSFRLFVYFSLETGVFCRAVTRAMASAQFSCEKWLRVLYLLRAARIVHPLQLMMS